MVKFPHRQSKRSSSESTHRRSAECNHSGRGCSALPASIAIALSILNGSVRADDTADHFEAKVRPLLATHCYGCHGKTQQKGELRLDSRKALLEGGRSGPAIVSGNPQQSLLVQAISRTHARLKMPPKGQLPPYEIKMLTQWVNDGAVWPETPINAQQREFWSFQPVIRPNVPQVSHIVCRKNPIDAFVLDKLQQNKLTPGPPADKRTLIRRATYDLIGLPPTPKQVETFLRDDSPTAFQTVVERLLASWQYGEHWGRHWLDLVRYADTAGDAADYPIPEAYKYRNYVIDAFNQDKPYDEFIREQIAGDLLPYANDNARWKQTSATGYIAISRRIGVGPHNLRHITIEDTINNLGKTFLGLTVGCARCHDHKFDAIPTTDYYALYGIFDSSVYPHAGSEKKPRREEFVYRIGQDRADEILKPYRETLDRWDRKERKKFDEYQLFQKIRIADPTRTRAVVWKELQEVREQRRPFAEAFPDLEIAYAIQEGEPHDVHVQLGGDSRLQSHGELVQRGFLQVLGGQKLPAGHQGSGRRELAEWIADPQNPLTARVMLNRIWHYHFGQGLVKTTSDFGIRGTPPTHPKLLDYLATYFVEKGWSVKKMHLLIMLSRTYQLTSADNLENSASDPQNNLLWRANRRRLNAEQIRDSILSCSGQLDLTPGTRHPFPHRLTYFYRQHEPFQETYSTLRRSVYMMQQRIQKNPYLDLFDGPDGNLHSGERKSTTTTLQALYLMNSRFMHKQSRAFAERLLAKTTDTPGRVDWAYRTIFARHPDEKDTARAEVYLKQAGAQLANGDHCDVDRQMWAGYLRGMLSSNEFMFVD